MKKNIIIPIIGFMTIASCATQNDPQSNHKEDKNNPNEISVSGSCTFLDARRATINSYINMSVEDASNKNVEYGILLSTHELISSQDYEQKYIGEKRTGDSYITYVCHLFPSTTYFYRSYVREGKESDYYYHYGEVRSFTTPKGNIPEYVDLGLSVKWSTKALGATDEYSFGALYAWGEIKPKDKYLRGNYKFICWDWWSSWYEDMQAMTKYTFCKQGAATWGPDHPDHLSTLQMCDDVAHIDLGEGWRIPTYEEFQELEKYCKKVRWKGKDHKGNYSQGYNYVASNGNYIYIEDINTGHGNTEEGYDNDNLSCLRDAYWTSSVYVNENKTLSNSYQAWCYYQYSVSGWIYVGLKKEVRWCGAYIRPIYIDK